MKCKLFPSAFSGEVVFQVKTLAGESYEGVAPKHYAEPNTQPGKAGVDGQIQVRVLSNGGKKARVFAPDGQILDVSADRIHEAK
jgi:hypothetical protein